MNLQKLCRTCLKEIINKPVQLSEQLYAFLENDLKFNEVPRSHAVVKLPKNICFDCYNSVITFRRFYKKCKDASQYFKTKLDSSQNITSRDENTTNKYNYEELNNDEVLTYITIEKANDALQDDEHAEILQQTHQPEFLSDDDVQKPPSNLILWQHADKFSHIDVEHDNYDEKILIETDNDISSKPESSEFNLDDCIVEEEENVLIEAAFQSENYDIEPPVRPKVTSLFVCKICGMELHGKTELRVHETTHPGLRPFPCEVCGVAFKQRSALNTHLPLHYGKTIPCPLCDKKFARKSFLTLHIRAHRGEKPFQCEQCGKTFRTGHLLAGHEQEHTGKLQFSCKFCSKSFYNRRSLIAHINHTHTHYYCNHCGKCFKKRPKLYEHLKRDHNIKEESDGDYTKRIENKMKS